MKIDWERLQLLVYKYAGKCQEAQDAKTEMEAAHNEANAVMDEITAYLEEVNAANEKMDGELERLQKAEAERASIKPEPKPEHTCRECRYLERGTKSDGPQCFCLNIDPDTFVDRNEEDVACGKFEPKKKDEEPEEAKTCGDCKHFDRTIRSSLAGECVFPDRTHISPMTPEHAACKLFEAREEDDEPEEPEEDKRCGDCVRYNARKLWCEGHGIPVVASSGACPDYRKEGF